MKRIVAIVPMAVMMLAISAAPATAEGNGACTALEGRGASANMTNHEPAVLAVLESCERQTLNRASK
jgi:hypothetical protein